MDFFDERKQQEKDAANRKRLAELKKERNQILRRLESGEITKLPASELNKLAPAERLHWARKIKITGV